MNPSGTVPDGASGLSSSAHRTPFGPEWCIHAQLTISHPSQPDRNERIKIVPESVTTNVKKNPNQTSTVGNNVHFQYSWTTSNDGTTFTEIVPEVSGIQKFESWPRSSDSSADTQTKSGHQDSGYNTEYNTTLPVVNKSRIIQPYGRRCRSTCTITLSNANEICRQSNVYSKDDTDSSLIKFGGTVVSRTTQKDAETQTSVNVDASTPGMKNLSFQHLKPSSTSAHSGSIGRSSYVDRNRRPRYRKQTPGEIDETPSQHSSRNHYRSPACSRARSSPPIRIQQK